MGGFISGIGFGWNVEALGFLYGYIVGREETKTKVCKFFNQHYYIVVGVSFIASLILGIAYLQYKNIWFWGDYLLRIMLGIVLVLFVLSLTYRIKIGNNISSYLGNISYEVFLIHGFVMSLLNVVSSSIFTLSSGEYIALTFGFTIIFASIFYMLDSLISKQIRRI